MIAGIGCSETMTEALLALPEVTFNRVLSALTQAFQAPETIQAHESVEYSAMELHVIVAEGVLFVLGDNLNEIRLLQVTVFRPDSPAITIH